MIAADGGTVDIAGTAYDARSEVIADKGATGFGLRLLVDLARRWETGLAGSEL